MDIKKADNWQADLDEALAERGGIRRICTRPENRVEPAEYAWPRGVEAEFDRIAQRLEQMAGEVLELADSSDLLEDDPSDDEILSEFLERALREKWRVREFDRRYGKPTAVVSRGSLQAHLKALGEVVGPRFSPRRPAA